MSTLGSSVYTRKRYCRVNRVVRVLSYMVFSAPHRCCILVVSGSGEGLEVFEIVPLLNET